MGAEHRVIAAVGLGSNLGDRHAHIAFGVAAMAGLPRSGLVARSSVIETAAVGEVGDASAGGPYLNAVVLIKTELGPAELLSCLHALERARGRDRASEERRWLPRTLDLDLLVYGDRQIAEPGLSVPHPRMLERRFVLEPLAEIAPLLVVPGTGRCVSELLEHALSKEAPC